MCLPCPLQEGRTHLGVGLPEGQHSLCPLVGVRGAPRWKLPGGRERPCERRIFPNPQSREERANTWPEWKQRVRDRKRHHQCAHEAWAPERGSALNRWQRARPLPPLLGWQVLRDWGRGMPEGPGGRWVTAHSGFRRPVVFHQPPGSQRCLQV